MNENTVNTLIHRHLRALLNSGSAALFITRANPAIVCGTSGTAADTACSVADRATGVGGGGVIFRAMVVSCCCYAFLNQNDQILNGCKHTHTDSRMRL